MSLIIKTNSYTGNILNNLYTVNNKLFKSMEKLSSGLKINSASDDPAGLVISEQMRSRIASLNQEIENTGNLINKYETASSTALELRSMLTEMRSLAVAAGNTGVNDSATQQVYQDSLNSLAKTYNNIVNNASFGTQKLFDGSEGSLTSIAQLGNINLADAQSAEEAINYLDDMAARLDNTVSELGATQKNELEANLRNLRIESQNLTAAESQIRDVDFGLEFSEFMKNKLLLNSAVALLAQGNMLSNTVLSLIGNR
ncbi:MAG: flagellin [Candidatus Zixiibacteriota bacterium]